MPEIILQPVVDSLDQVAESHRDLYEERDSKFVLSKPIKIDDPAEIRSALAQERETRRQLAQQVKDLPPDAKDKLKKLDELERNELERKGRFDELIKTNEEKWKTERESLTKRISTLESGSQQKTRTNDATASINEARGSVKGLLPHVMPHLKTVEEPEGSGEYKTYVIDPAKPDEARLNAKGQPMTLAELHEEFRADPVLAKLYDASPASGPGGGGSQFKTGSKRVIELTAEEAKDPRKYEQLKAMKQKGEIDGAVDHMGRSLV